MRKVIFYLTIYITLSIMAFITVPWIPCLGMAMIFGFSNYSHKGKKLVQFSSLLTINLLAVLVGGMIWLVVRSFEIQWIRVIPWYEPQWFIIHTIGFTTLAYLIGYSECEKWKNPIYEN